MFKKPITSDILKKYLSKRSIFPFPNPWSKTSSLIRKILIFLPPKLPAVNWSSPPSSGLFIKTIAKTIPFGFRNLSPLMKSYPVLQIIFFLSDRSWGKQSLRFRLSLSLKLRKMILSKDGGNVWRNWSHHKKWITIQKSLSMESSQMATSGNLAIYAPTYLRKTTKTIRSIKFKPYTERSNIWQI